VSVLTIIWAAAIVLIGSAIGWMLVLIVMRTFDTRRSARRAADRANVERAFVALIRGDCNFDRDLKPYVHRARLIAETLLDFLAIVRGPDRGVVVEALREAGVVKTLCARVRRGSVAGRTACLEALGAFHGPDAESTLQDVVSNGTPRMRVAALRALQEIGNFVSVARVVSELVAGRVRATAMVGEFLRKLAERAPGDAVAALSEEGLPASVRILLIDALGAAGDYQAVPVLSARAVDLESEVRAAAVGALGKLQHPAATPILQVALHDPDWRVRSAAAEAVGAARLVKLSSELSQSLSDEIWRVRFQAAAALTRMGPSGREHLEAAARNDDAGGRAAALALAESAA
jgi:HEAT repeat protein